MLDSNGSFVHIYNAASSEIKGLELFIDKDINSQLTLTAGGSYNDGRYKNFVFGENSNQSGESFLNAPKYKVSVGGTYRFDNRLTVNSDVIYQDGSPSQYLFDGDGNVTGGAQERRLCAGQL